MNQSDHPIKDFIYPFLVMLLPGAFLLGMLRLHGTGPGLISVGWLFLTTLCYMGIHTRRFRITESTRCIVFGLALVTVGVGASALTDIYSGHFIESTKEKARLFDVQLLSTLYLIISAGVGGNAVFHGVLDPNNKSNGAVE